MVATLILRSQSVPPPPPPPPPPPETGFERIQKDQQLQSLWLNRFIAYVIDSIIVGVAVSLIAVVIAMPVLLIDVFTHGFRPEFWAPWSAFSGLMSIISLFYYAFSESSRGATIGKGIMGLKVITGRGEKPSLDKAFLRNVSKLHWVILLLDILIGLGTAGNPNQKFSDRYVGTLVVRSMAGISQELK